MKNNILQKKIINRNKHVLNCGIIKKKEGSIWVSLR